MRVALYGRVSTDNGKQDVENQMVELREFSRRSGWEVSIEYVDKASGKDSLHRPQFLKMLGDADKRKFDLLLFWSLDRLSREGVLATLTHLQRLSQAGVDWRSYQERYFDSCGPFKDAVISIMATLAQQERLRISERTKAGLKRAVREGKTLGRPKVDVNIEKALKLRAAGMGLRGIATQIGCGTMTVSRMLRSA
jgi:DNA invertase Pin-like site-specific DNA recombinase